MSAQTTTGTRIDGGEEAAVAVIVVHGVADQPRGDTVEAVAQQIAGASGAAVQRADVPVAVPADRRSRSGRGKPKACAISGARS